MHQLITEGIFDQKIKNKSRFPKFLIAMVGIAFLIGLIIFTGLFVISSNARDNQDPTRQKDR